jgi:O-methyltransferase/aklanonic acid methyltransferase
MDPAVPDRAHSSAAKARLVRMYDEIAPTYGTALDIADVFGRELIAAAHLEPGARVLDLACGRGACLRPALEAVGTAGFVLGIDLSPEMVALLARDLQRDGVTNAEARLADAEDVEFAPGSFDAVTCGLSIHHFEDLTATLSAYRTMLRDGGRFAASTFADGTVDYPWVLDALAETGLFPSLQGQSQQHRIAGAPELRQSLNDAGYAPIVTTRVDHRFVFADVDAYITWVRTQGLGTTVNRLQPEHLQVFVDACARRLDEHHAAPDGYELLKSVDLTIATSP